MSNNGYHGRPYIPTGPRGAFTPRQASRPPAFGPALPPNFRSFQEPFAAQQRRNRSSDFVIPSITIAPPPDSNQPQYTIAQSRSLPSSPPSPSSHPFVHRRTRRTESAEQKLMEVLDEVTGRNVRPPHPSVLDPNPPAPTMSYMDAITFIKKQAGPMIAKMKNLPDRTFTLIIYDPAGSPLYIQNSLSIKGEMDIIQLITWFQMFADYKIAKTNYKESLLIRSVHIRHGANEEKGQLPLLTGMPWIEKVDGVDAANVVVWETGGSDLELYWTSYRTMMQMLQSEHEPMFKVFTVRFYPSNEKKIGRVEGKEMGGGHFFKSSKGMLSAKDFFSDKGGTELLARMGKTTSAEVDKQLNTGSKKEDSGGAEASGSAGVAVQGTGGKSKYEGLSSDSSRTQAIIDGRMTPSSSHRSTSLTFDITAPRGKRLNLTDRVPSEETLNATKPPIFGPDPPEIPLAEECIKKSQKWPGEWKPFHLNGKTGYTFKKYTVPWDNGDPKKNWGYYQRMGGDPMNHDAFSLDHVPFEESTFKFADSGASDLHQISNVLKNLSMPVPPELRDPMYADKFCIIIDEDEEDGDGTAMGKNTDNGSRSASKGKGKAKEEGPKELSPKSLRIKNYLEMKEKALGFEDDDDFFPDPSVRVAPAPPAVGNPKSSYRGRPGQRRNSVVASLQDKLLNKVGESSQQSTGSPVTPIARPSAVDVLAASVASTMNANVANFPRSASDTPSNSALNVNAPSFESPGLNFNAGGQSSDTLGFFGQQNVSAQGTQYRGRSGTPTSNFGGFDINAQSFLTASRSSTPSINSFTSFHNLNQSRPSSHSRNHSRAGSTSPQKRTQFIPNTNIPNIPFGSQGMAGGRNNYQGHASVPSLNTPYSHDLFTNTGSQRSPSSRFFPQANVSQDVRVSGNSMGGGNMAGNNAVGLSSMGGNNFNTQPQFYQGNMGMGNSQQFGHGPRSSMGGSQYSGGDFVAVNQGFPAFGQQLEQTRNMYGSAVDNQSVNQSFGSNNSFYGGSASGSGAGLGSPFAQLNLNSPFAHQAQAHEQGQSQAPPGLNNPFGQQGGQGQRGGASTTFFFGGQGGSGGGGNGGL